MKRPRGLLALPLAVAIALLAAADSPVGFRFEHAVHTPPPAGPVPLLGAAFRDPTFGTKLVRVTDPSQVPGVVWIRHYYAKSQPFNADGSLAILFRSDGGASLYDARGWVPIANLALGGSDPEIQWHPTDPALFYFLARAGGSADVRALYRYDVRNGTRTLVHDFPEYDAARSRNEGNMDREGRFYAMVGRKGARWEAFVYDIAHDRVIARVPVEERLVDDWISVSPSGRYVVMMGKDRSRVYDIELRHLRDLPAGSIGHGDLCQLDDGSEALVYDGADYRLWIGRHVNIARLDTGRHTVGVRIGWRTSPHVSCRNVRLPGWALISTQGPDGRYPNHDFEVFWLKLDGSGHVQRLAHHRGVTKDAGYFAEPHAVADPQGRRVLFASNWGGHAIADYLAESDPPESIAAVVTR